VLQCRDRALAEELAQEALARAWERWDRVSDMASPEGWVFRVAFNLAASERRRAAAARRATERSTDPIVAQHDSSDRAVVLDALQRLPLRQRAAVVCRYYLDLSVPTTAEALGCAEGTVKALCHQGLAALRSDLGALLVAEEGCEADG
jgi:RNA polymerase sigma-70 factor (ECF subfamily)